MQTTQPRMNASGTNKAMGTDTTNTDTSMRGILALALQILQPLKQDQLYRNEFREGLLRS